MPMSDVPRWTRDLVLWSALCVAVLLRAAPLWMWGWDTDLCTRDECIYKIVARPIVAGEGLGLAPRGWLPAPGFPYLMAWCFNWLGSFEAVKWVHVALAVPSTVLMYLLGHRVEDRRVARAAAWAFALHPTFIFFAGTMWTETVYTFLLLATVQATLWAREGRWRRAVLPGALLGLTVLNRGVATYMAPLFLAALLAPESLALPALRAAATRQAKHAAAFGIALVLVVAPYSISASSRWGGPVISDATLGHVIALGNDDYPPITFDYLNGQLTGRLYGQTLRRGRRDCPQRNGPLEADKCEVDRARAWIAAHPAEFVARVPLRLSQLLNPNSFLTRHLRWNYWRPMPWALKEGLVLYQLLVSGLILGLGTFAAWSRARGPYGLLSVGLVLYNVAVISALYGLTRFRLPLEPFWMLFAVAFLVHPRRSLATLRAHPGRAVGAVVSTTLVVWLMSEFAWTAFPGF